MGRVGDNTDLRTNRERANNERQRDNKNKNKREGDRPVLKVRSSTSLKLLRYFSSPKLSPFRGLGNCFNRSSGPQHGFFATATASGLFLARIP